MPQSSLVEIRDNISVRAYNCLVRSGIYSIEDLEQKTESDLLSIREFGVGCLREVKSALLLVYIQKAISPENPENVSLEAIAHE